MRLGCTSRKPLVLYLQERVCLSVSLSFFLSFVAIHHKHKHAILFVANSRQNFSESDTGEARLMEKPPADIVTWAWLFGKWVYER